LVGKGKEESATSATSAKRANRAKNTHNHGYLAEQTLQVDQKSIDAMSQPPLRIALLESNNDVAQTLLHWLRDSHHRCHVRASGAEFEKLVSEQSFDVAVLSASVPDRSAEELLNWMRNTSEFEAPIACYVDPRECDTVAWLLYCGADDCWFRSIGRYEFLMRLRALMRRGAWARENDTLQLGNLRLDPRTRQVFVANREVQTSPKEFALVYLLLSNRGRMISRTHIFERIWPCAKTRDTRTVNTHISTIRGKLNLVPSHGWNLTSEYGRGYCLDRVESG
jgi:DNA-binding response OmpR family regulator